MSPPAVNRLEVKALRGTRETAELLRARREARNLLRCGCALAAWQFLALVSFQTTLRCRRWMKLAAPRQSFRTGRSDSRQPANLVTYGFH